MADSQIFARDPSTHALFPLKLYDNGDGTYSLDQESVDVTAIKAKTDYLQNLEDGVYFDSTVTANTSTTWPSGTAQNPTTSMVSAKTMADARKVKKIYVNGAATLSATMEGYIFVGAKQATTITLGSQDVDTSYFYNCTITGTQGGTGKIYLYNCSLYDLVDCDINTFDCNFTGSITPRKSSINFLTNQHIGGITVGIVDFDGVDGAWVIFQSAIGEVTVQESTNSNNIVLVDGKDGCVFNSASSNTDGSMIARGDTLFTKGKGGCTETDQTLYAQIGAYTGDGGVLIDSSIKAALDLVMISLAAIEARSGQSIVKAFTCDLHKTPGTYSLVICSSHAVIIDSIIFTPTVDVSDDTGGITGISIHDDDTTTNTFITQANGVKANLTAYRQLSWTGAVKTRVGKNIQITIYGASADTNPTTCDIEITYHAVASGGTLELSTAVLYECAFCTQQFSALPVESNPGDPFMTHFFGHMGGHFGETGTPGWIVEDIYPDGVINLLDMISLGQGNYTLVEIDPGVFKLVY
jgi:hypothetical protein